MLNQDVVEDYPYTLDIVRDNGLRVLHIPMGLDIAHVQIDVKCGLDDEVESQTFESAHFIEHLIAQLTSTKDDQRRESGQLSSDLESMGISWNAFTTPQRTGYYLSGPKEAFQEMTYVLVHAFFWPKELNPKFQDEEIFKNEKSAVQQELKRYAASEWVDMASILAKILYPNHPRSNSVNDRLKNTKSLVLNDLISFMHNFYATEEIIISLASPYVGIEDEQGRDFVSNLMTQTLSKVTGLRRKKIRDFPLLEIPSPPTREESQVIVKHLSNPNAISSRILIAFRLGYSYWDRVEKYSMLAISMTLTRGFSSRLFKRLRTLSGLVYSIQSESYLDPYDKNMSTFILDTSTINSEVGKVIDYILQEISKLAKEGITQREYNKYKKRINFRLSERALDKHPSKWVSTYTENLIWKREVVTESKQKENALSITKSQIESTARDTFLDPKQIVITYGGPQNFNNMIEKSLDLLLLSTRK